MSESKSEHLLRRIVKAVLLLLLAAALIFIAGSESVKEWVDTWLYPRLYR